MFHTSPINTINVSMICGRTNYNVHGNGKIYLDSGNKIIGIEM